MWEQFSKKEYRFVTAFENKSSRAYFEVWRLHPWHQAINKSTQVFTIYRIVWLAQEFNDILSHWQLLFGVCGGKMDCKIIHDDLTIFFYLYISCFDRRHTCFLLVALLASTQFSCFLFTFLFFLRFVKKHTVHYFFS